MRRSVLAWPLVMALLVSGCGDDGDSETAGSGGSAGTGGGAGAAGSGGGGAGGSAGLAGSAGTAGSGGGAGASGAGGSAGASGAGGGSCSDPGPEPNDSEVLASPACGSPPCVAGDCDDEGSTGYGGTLAPAGGVIGPGEVDYLKYDGKDELGLCQVNATAKTADSGFRLCLFVSCDAGTKLNGCTQGTVDQSPTGIPGCCVTAPGTVEANHDCGGTVTDNDSAHVFLRVDQATACTPYAIDYHF